MWNSFQSHCIYKQRHYKQSTKITCNAFLASQNILNISNSTALSKKKEPNLASDFTSSESGVGALALTPQDDFGDLPNSGKASKRDLRPWLKSVLTAGENHWQDSAAMI
ncbi:hypothetical protein JP39_11100 [Companilactobacillus heilongjiangensis]|uniref:Uncharacterized protein n=1 Tax=Companilactobacillus heilongjiangensis TaxID=1074467 RepID=A0A0K2LF06_9LACO|nr:hypothetical protein JP39_11100 [Companilactobacillus heilongjiangensis]